MDGIFPLLAKDEKTGWSAILGFIIYICVQSCCSCICKKIRTTVTPSSDEYGGRRRRSSADTYIKDLMFRSIMRGITTYRPTNRTSHTTNAYGTPYSTNALQSYNTNAYGTLYPANGLQSSSTNAYSTPYASWSSDTNNYGTPYYTNASQSSNTNAYNTPNPVNALQPYSTNMGTYTHQGK